MVTFPLWFMIFIGLLSLLIISRILTYLLMPQMVNKYFTYTIEERKKYVNKYEFMKKFYKIAIFITPINLVVFPFIFYMYFPKYYFHATTIVVTISLMQFMNYFYVKLLLKKVGKIESEKK